MFLLIPLIELPALSVALAAMLCMAPVPARATLGQDESTIDADGVRMQARRALRAEGGYTVHEMQLESGTIVREYVSPGGRIFALAWRGPTLPDLVQLLGAANYHSFLNDPDSRRIPRRMRRLQRDDLVVHSEGGPRAFFGHAYVPALLPPGFAVEHLRGRW